jgi:hypothetical protein
MVTCLRERILIRQVSDTKEILTKTHAFRRNERILKLGEHHSIRPDQILGNKMLRKIFDLRERMEQKSEGNYTVWSVVT